MNTYHKIDTIYVRDMNGTKKLIEGTFRDETIEFLNQCGLQWQFTEKVDGTNIRIHWDGYKVEFAGRTDRAQIPPKLLEKLNEMFGTPEAEELFEQQFGETDVILYGEGYGAGIQKGGLYRPDVSFILFDVQIGDVFLRRETVCHIANCFGIDVVPVVLTGTLDQGVSFVKTNPHSVIGSGDAEMEGLAGRPIEELKDRLGKRIIVKIKARDFAK